MMCRMLPTIEMRMGFRFDRILLAEPSNEFSHLDSIEKNNATNSIGQSSDKMKMRWHLPHG